MLLADSGACFTFGSPQFGQLGYTVEATDGRRPRVVDELKTEHVDMVACGDTFTVAVTRGTRADCIC